MAGRQFLFDRILPGKQPVHCRIDLISARLGDAQVRAQRGVGPPAHGGQLEAGATARAIISPYARSRCSQSGPRSFFSPSRDASTCAAATCPCGNDRSISNISPASTSTDPESDALSAVIAVSGSADRFASVSFFTFPPSR